MRIKLVLDRYEGDFGVCLGENKTKHEIKKDVLLGVNEQDIFTIEFDGENYHSPEVLHEETAKKKEEISSRMKKLFQMSRHRRPPRL